MKTFSKLYMKSYINYSCFQHFRSIFKLRRRSAFIYDFLNKLCPAMHFFYVTHIQCLQKSDEHCTIDHIFHQTHCFVIQCHNTKIHIHRVRLCDIYNERDLTASVLYLLLPPWFHWTYYEKCFTTSLSRPSRFQRLNWHSAAAKRVVHYTARHDHYITVKSPRPRVWTALHHKATILRENRYKSLSKFNGRIGR